MDEDKTKTVLAYLSKNIDDLTDWWHSKDPDRKLSGDSAHEFGNILSRLQSCNIWIKRNENV